MQAKILIIGGGAMGTCIAMHAASRCDPLREPVVLIEKERLGAGSSGRTGAIVHRSYGDRAMAGMARDALKVYAGMKSSTGRTVGYRRTGVLVYAGPGDSEAAARLERDVEMQLSLGIGVRLVEAEEMRRLVPGIEVGEGSLGAYDADGGFINPQRAIETFAVLARSHGAITRIGVREPTIHVEHGRVVGVDTAAGSFRAPIVVLAVGPWTASILHGLDADLPLRVVRTQELLLRMPNPENPEEDDLHDGGDGGPAEFETRFIPDPLENMPVAHPVVIDLEHGVYARCEPNRARTRVGRVGLQGLDELEGEIDLSDEVDPEFRTWAREAIAARMPVYAQQTEVGAQASPVTVTPDERPIAGPVESIDGLYVVTGFSGNDFQLAPSIGEGMAQMMLDQPVSAIDPEFLSPARFQRA